MDALIASLPHNNSESKHDICTKEQVSQMFGVFKKWRNLIKKWRLRQKIRKKLAQSLFFRNFGRILKPSLLIGGLRDNAIFEVTNWKPSDIRILLQSAYY